MSKAREIKSGFIGCEYKYYEWACFTSQLSAEKVIKALAMKYGFSLWGHSMTEILKILSQKIEIAERIKDNAELLDLYYMHPGYPSE